MLSCSWLVVCSLLDEVLCVWLMLVCKVVMCLVLVLKFIVGSS